MGNFDSDHNNIVYQIVGKNIRKYRRLRGLKQSQLAELCHLSEGFIRDLESDTFRTISLNTLYLISTKLKIPIMQLFDDIEES